MIEKEHLPKGWELKKLGEVCDKISNGSSAKQYEDKVGLPISRIETIWNEKIDYNRVKYVLESDEAFIEKYSLRNNDILFSHINSDSHIGKTAIFKSLPSEKLIHGINLLLIRVNKLIQPDFFNYQLNFLRRSGLFASIAQKSVNQSSINQSKLKNVEIVLPPLPEQEKIVAKIEELFSELDKGKEQLQTALQQLKVYRQAVLKYAFEGKLTNTNVKEDELPEGWKWVKLGEVAINFDNKRIPLSRDVRANRKGKYRYYGATEIVDYIDDYIFNGTYLLIGEDGANLLSKARDLSFIVKGKFWVNNHAHVLQAKQDIILEYICFYFNSLDLSQFVTGSAQPKLTKANLNKIQVPLPSTKEQQQIVAEIERRLSVCDKIEETINQALSQTETLRQSILKKAFEGKLV